MSKYNLEGKHVAVLVADGFEESEFTQPVQALKEAGAKVSVVSPSGDSVKAWSGEDWGDTYTVDVPLEHARPESFHALLLPGGVMNPDTLRQEPKAVQFARLFFESHKPVAAICHGPQLLVDAGVLHNREMTSYPSIKADMVNAGAKWMDREVVVDSGFVTSRRPADLDAFCDKMLEEFAEGRHGGQHA